MFRVQVHTLFKYNILLDYTGGGLTGIQIQVLIARDSKLCILYIGKSLNLCELGTFRDKLLILRTFLFISICSNNSLCYFRSPYFAQKCPKGQSKHKVSLIEMLFELKLVPFGNFRLEVTFIGLVKTKTPHFLPLQPQY